MLTFSFFTICILGALIALAVEAANSLRGLYARYKYITSPEFKAYVQSLSAEERLTYKYNGFTRLIGALFFMLIGTFILNTPVWVALVIVAAMIWALNKNSKIAKELGRNY